MNSFRAASTIGFRRQSAYSIRWRNITTARWMSRSAEAHANAVAKQSTQPSKRITFDDLGLHLPILAALRAGFPNVQYPTEAQEKFIPAILNGKDVLLKDATGSGKSFGLILALLNKPRLQSSGIRENRYITSLVIVPHRDLAHQLYHWIQKMATAAEVHPPPPIASLAQVVVRDGLSHLTTGLRNLRDNPPHILIGTPQALFDIWREDPESLQLSHLSCVVVDEVDYLIETLPKKDPNRSFRKAAIKASKKLQAHPGITRGLLDVIYAQRKQMNEGRHDEPGATQYRRRSGLKEQRGDSPSPQLIMSSATLRSHLNNYLYEESGWLNRDNLLKVKGATFRTRGEKSDNNGLGASGILHSVLLVSDTGIENIGGAVPHSSDAEQHLPIDAETLFAQSTKLETADIEGDLVEKYLNSASPFNPNAMDAIATAFALDVPKIALLVLPSSSPIQRAVQGLREMGVNAHSLDLLVDGNGRSHLLSGPGTEEDDPTLLVSTLATTRGLDLPELSHVFILGIPGGPKVTGRTIDAYLHAAGRVGRFGRGGKVITIVEKDDDTESGPTAESSKMRKILDAIGVNAVQFEHFD